LARALGVRDAMSWRATARAVTSVAQPLSRVPIALMQPMINPATARVWAVCEEGDAAVPEEGDAAVPDDGEAVPEDDAVPGAGAPTPVSGDVTVGDGVSIAGGRVTVGWVMKRPMNAATTRMLVITPNVIKASLHTRNRTFRRPLGSELSKLVLSGCASSTVNTSRTDQLLSVWLLIRPSPSSTARLY
jgi:hypothetical protein